MLPVLQALADGKDAHVRQRVASAEGLQEMLPSGQFVFTNRVGWAVSHLNRANVLERVQYGVYRTSDDGKRWVSRPPAFRRL